jgi:pyruvate/2-oxoglutarate dehydrogenase complex dihydrolipoamide acyltransferase (E2) component
MSDQKKSPYKTVPFPKVRRTALDAGYMGKRRHIIHGLIELDVSKPRRLIREEEARSGKKLSFTAFVVHCLGDAAAAHPEVHAYRDWRNRLVIFDDINVNTMIEVTMEGRKVPMPYIIKAVNRKPLRDIHHEIRSAQENPPHTLESRYMTQFLRLPAFLRRLFYRSVMRFPYTFRNYSSSILVTAVGMFAKGSGWGIPLANFSLTVTLGGLSEKPCVHNGKIEVCEILDATLSFDHDIVDGGPAARFTQLFKELIEGAHGLSNTA